MSYQYCLQRFSVVMTFMEDKAPYYSYSKTISYITHLALAK